MIAVPTTFVIGAGASEPYGLPTGGALTTTARRLQSDSQLYQILLDVIERWSPSATAELNKFISDLKADPAISIDSFLETRDEHQRRIGHAMIAAILGAEIHTRGVQRPNAAQDWLGEIVDVMRSGARTLEQFLNGNSDVTFVTFNFDSIIEVDFDRLLRGIYSACSEVEREAVLARFPVLHVHGQLPRPKSMTPSWVDEAAHEVRVVHDEIDNGVKTAAQKAIIEANVLCFLGFSYHFENLTTLNLRSMFATPHQGPDHVFGSAYGLFPGQQKRVEEYFSNRIKLGGEKQTAKEVLRQFFVLRDFK